MIKGKKKEGWPINAWPKWWDKVNPKNRTKIFLRKKHETHK